jgi:fructokinase
MLEERRIPTTAPEPTLRAVREFFDAMQAKWRPLTALGVGSFGPIDLDRRSPAWGRLLTTPKPGWSGVDLLAPLRERLSCPIALETDVNAAALAEARLGAGRGASSVAYVTVGTGIGGGAIVNGRTLRGAMHPEMGHIHIRRGMDDQTFRGVCPFHGDCIEGLASGPAILARWGQPIEQLPDDHEARRLLGDYLGQLAAAISLLLSTERIVFGGGVMSDGRLLPHVRLAWRARLNGYLPSRPDAPPSGETLCAPDLGAKAGIVGAILLAIEAAAHGLHPGDL